MQSRFAALLLGDREDPRQRLAALFGGEVPRAGQPPEPALAWAREVLAGHPGTVSEVEAVRLLRAAEPRLLLKPAQFLARHAVHG
ncbi:MAG TPA: hypothetical protein VK060_09135 [Ruania sp.]|nr:hypothetical protein [Ruania sp.]